VRQAFGEVFEIRPGYLNTASIGVPSVRMAQTMIDTIADWRTGASEPAEFEPDVEAARAAWARLVGVSPSDVAIGATASQLIGLVAASVPDGTRVLTVRNEFTSVTFPFAAQAHRGVMVTEVDAEQLTVSVAATDLVAVSAVQSADGAVAELAALRAAAAAVGARVVLDVTQAAGWMPLDLGWADYVVGAAYKWLLAPRGASWLAVRADRLDELVPQGANWFAAEDIWKGIYGLPLRLAASARRLDLSPAWFSHRGAAASLPWIASLDMTAVRDHCVGLANATLTGLGLAPGNSAIIAIELGEDQAARLADAGVAASVRAGRVRLSYHLYNTVADVDLVLDALQR
jgi:selenocysteine lyase/cysteine desulfurase